jgi:DNA topoisomerase-1
MNIEPRSTEIKYVNDGAMSIHKQKKGKGYQYFDEDSEKITDKLILSRLQKIIIPPMWSDVYICKWDNGHIQAIGRDAKGRKQYIYHATFEKSRQQEKFAKMKDFGKALPKFRKKVGEDIALKEWSKNKILALIILLLDETGIRIGNKQYANQNGTFGLTTLRRKHMSFDNSQVVFEYKGKSNQMRHVEIDDAQLAKLIKKSAELPGFEIFRYKDSDGHFQPVDSEDVNDYIHAHMGKKFSSKDFRTWVGSRLAVELYPFAIDAIGKSKKGKISNTLIKMVANELGNTPMICKCYYVHPNIVQKIESKSLPNKTYFDTGMLQYTLTSSEKEIMKHL